MKGKEGHHAAVRGRIERSGRGEKGPKIPRGDQMIQRKLENMSFKTWKQELHTPKASCQGC